MMDVNEEFKELLLVPDIEVLNTRDSDRKEDLIRHHIDYLLKKSINQYNGIYAFIATQTGDHHEDWKVDSVISHTTRTEPKHKTWVIKFIRDPVTLEINHTLSEWLTILKPISVSLQTVGHVKIIPIHPMLLGFNIRVTLFVLCTNGNAELNREFDFVIQSLVANIVMKMVDLKIHNYHNAFVSNLTHKIRTPLNGILYMGPLLSETQLTEHQQEYMNAITKSSIALASVISDTVDISRLAFHQLTLKKEVFSVRECIDDALQFISADAINRKISINTIMDSSVPPYIYCDYKRLRQILVILLNNAVAFTNKIDGSGMITIRISATIVEDAHTHTHTPKRSTSGMSSTAEMYPSEKYLYYSVEFSVGDNGIGMTDEQQSTVLDSFWLNIDSTNITGSGRQIVYDTSGLGLAIAQKLSQLMGGDLWLGASEVDKGSQFTFNIIAPEDEYPSYITHNSLKTIRGKNVIIVDSDMHVRMRFYGTVTKWGMNCTSIATQEEIMILYLNSKITIHIMFIGESLLTYSSGSSRSNVIKAIRDQKHTFPIVVIRSIGDNLTMLPRRMSTDDNACEPNAYLISPIDDKELMLTTINLLEKKKSSVNLLAEVKTPAVLVAEDDKVNQIVFENLLPRLGYHTFTITSNGREALSELVNNPHKYGIMLIDIRMPMMNGIVLSEAIWKLYNTTLKKPESMPYMIGVSAQPLQESDSMGKLQTFVAKPIDIKLFEEALRQASISL